METEQFFIANGTTYLNFIVNQDRSFLPFPLNQNFYWRYFISAALMVILAEGSKKRLLIIAYLRSPEAKLNPPAILFALDQVNGIFLALSILFRIAFFVSPQPLSDLVDPRVCDFAEVMSVFYISGTIGWRCYMAVFKLLYVKGHQWVKNSRKAYNILATQITLCSCLMVMSSVIMIKGDKDSYIKRACHHKTTADLEILYSLEPGDSWRKLIPGLVFLGMSMTITELTCYILLFRHIAHHNNHVMTGMLDPKVIAMRNHINAVTLKGLFATWMMEVLQLFFAGFLSSIIGNQWNREVTVFLRQLEYIVVPLVQIHTSPPIKRFLLSKT